MTRIALKTRVGVSLIAVGIVWLLTAIAFGLYYRDVKAMYGLLIWSVPFFAVGWATLGIPMIALSNHFPLVPGFSLILALAGALAGGMIMLAPATLARWISPQSHFVPIAWTDVTGWPALGAAIGAAGAGLYSWLLSKSVRSSQQGKATE